MPTDILKLRHSAAHLLAMAVVSLYKDAKIGACGVTETGFYYDINFSEPLSSDELVEIEQKMNVFEQELSDIYSMWTICEHNSKKWNYMSSILKLTDDYENSLVVDIAKTKINEFLVGYKNQISMSDFVAILKELADAGFLLQYSDKKE